MIISSKYLMERICVILAQFLEAKHSKERAIRKLKYDASVESASIACLLSFPLIFLQSHAKCSLSLNVPDLYQ